MLTYRALEQRASLSTQTTVGWNGHKTDEALFRWFAGEAVRNYGDVVPSSIKGVHNMVIKQPVGVCGISEQP